MIIKSDKLLAMIEHQNTNQTQIADRAGVSKQTITAWIKGERNPGIENVRRLANALNCSVEDIAEYETSLEDNASSRSVTDDVIKGRIDEIYSDLDRAGRAELLASAEQILKRNTPILPAPGTMTINTDLTSEQLPPKIPTELVARMVQEMDNPTSTPRGKFKGRWLLDKSFICPACGKRFFVSRTEHGAKMACPLCGQHVIIP